MPVNPSLTNRKRGLLMFTKLTALTGIVWGITLAFAGEAPTEPDVTLPTVPIVTTVPASTTTSSTTTSTAPAYGAHDALQADIEEWDALQAVNPNTPCQEWFVLAMSAGWPKDPDVLETLGWTMWKETRCQNIVAGHENYNGHDNGLMQINQIHRAYVEQLFGTSLEEAMAQPWNNLHFAWRLWSDRENSGKCGWQPWSVDCK
ncbi:MAG: hypothetical protein EBR30_27890 [Cytophagia bacterium]|nr:hypothetical protein [Cytophagia bacterium]